MKENNTIEEESLNDKLLNYLKKYDGTKDSDTYTRFEVKKFTCEDFTEGASWQKEKDKVTIDYLETALRWLLDAIPKQDLDHDWWPDELATSFESAKIVLKKLQSLNQ